MSAKQFQIRKWARLQYVTMLVTSIPLLLDLIIHGLGFSTEVGETIFIHLSDAREDRLG